MSYTQLKLKNILENKSRFTVSTNDNPEIIVDFPPPTGTGEGYNSTELFLISIASCAAATTSSICIARMQREIICMDVTVKGEYATSHPKIFEHIVMHFDIISPDLKEDELKTALHDSETKICPVWNMINEKVKTETTFNISRD